MTGPIVTPYHHAESGTFAYRVDDPDSAASAVIDAVLDFDPVTGRTSSDFSNRILDAAEADGRTIEWVLETHIHADHVSGAPVIKARTGAPIAAGARIGEVQAAFQEAFGYARDMTPDEAGFDRLFEDGEVFRIGGLEARVVATPGHTPACIAYVIGDAVFVGDTLFQPDSGTARCDFPGGDARTLFLSIRGLLESLPGETRMFVCHDYGDALRRAPKPETSVADQRAGNIHVRDGVSEDEFVAMREARDATLDLPRLILPSVQLNVRAGQKPDADENGVSRITLPLDYF